MKRSLFAFALLALPATLSAQNRAAACSTSGAANQASADACELAVDLFRYMAPQLGTSIAGGNATLGQGGTLGGPGHFAVGVRANAVFGNVPKLENASFSVTGPTSNEYETPTAVIPMPVVDAAIGVFKGIPLGVTNVGGVDLLLNAAYVPEYSSDNLDITLPDGNLKVGYGARVGLLQESLVSPGVSVSIMRRGLPAVDLEARPNAASTINARGMEVNTTSWRLTASKNLLLFGLALGVGQDSYDFTGTASASGNFGGIEASSTPTNLDFTMKRTNYFGNLYMNILLVKLVGEVGMVQGGKVDTYNTFETKADANRLYGSVGLRVGI